MANTTPRYVVNDQGYFALLEESVEEKGFRSWVENASSTTTSSLRFYIDGIGEDLTEPTGIADAMSEGGRPQGTIYDMQGRRVTNDGALKQGIYIIGGRKVIIR